MCVFLGDSLLSTYSTVSLESEFDNLSKAAFYRYTSNGSWVLHLPHHNNSDYAFQIWIDRGSGKIKYRVKSSGTWSGWLIVVAQ